MEIRTYTLNFPKQRAKQQKNVVAGLVKKAQNLKRKLTKNETQELLAEHDKIIRELESISLQRRRGACLRSKARWFEWGEGSSKYFLNLEKRNYQNKCVNKLKKDDSSTITAMNNKVFVKPYLAHKTPRYLRFWDGLGQVMVDRFNYAFTTGNFSISQRQGIIRLIPNKDKDPSYIKNWRPPSLLNVDYKIATQALALRLKKVLPQVINNAQTGYIEGRFIGQSIRQISDILSFAAEQNIEGIATFIDFEKAFYSLEWEFLSKTIATFDFCSDFKRWIQVLPGAIIRDGDRKRAQFLVLGLAP